jgi:2-oxoglutarate ferredoxin oxidoreductase subunit gamma
MIEKIIIAGAGGQGIMLLGKVLAEAALWEGKHTTWFPSYGAEVRGGAAYCMVVISDAEIGSPYIDRADTLIVMSAPALGKFKARLKNKGLLLMNTSLIAEGKENKNFAVIRHPFTDIALDLGNLRVANMVALGCYLSRKKIIKPANVLRAIEEIAPAEKKGLIEINRQALMRGMKLE